mmetsp:Transcript_106065/g.310131  ORF Transcript_106065/g.310131 Transcript_106065/m.310131 type:complete len:231 (+) Transcript_106065:60-752(+)
MLGRVLPSNGSRCSRRGAGLSVQIRLAPLLALGTCMGTTAARRPCTATITEDCDAGRFVRCGATLGSSGHSSAALVHPREVISCTSSSGQVRPREAVLVQFTKGPPQEGGECVEILMGVGECWGHDLDGDIYDCQGRCGAGCQPHYPGICSNWSQNCLRHDVCSYYYNSRGGALDPHCGYAFNMAAPDYAVPCLTDQRCQLSNFSTTRQVCQSRAGASSIDGGSPPELMV